MNNDTLSLLFIAVVLLVVRLISVIRVPFSEFKLTPLIFILTIKILAENTS